MLRFSPALAAAPFARGYADILVGLRELVSRFGAGSHLSRIPLPDQEEMREVIISAFTTKAKDDLDRLARDIAAARNRCRYLSADKLRMVVRRYIESLSAIRVRPTGGVYFVHGRRALGHPGGRSPSCARSGSTSTTRRPAR